jgi:hypothetical protein
MRRFLVVGFMSRGSAFFVLYVTAIVLTAIVTSTAIVLTVIVTSWLDRATGLPVSLAFFVGSMSLGMIIAVCRLLFGWFAEKDTP